MNLYKKYSYEEYNLSANQKTVKCTSVLMSRLWVWIARRWCDSNNNSSRSISRRCWFIFRLFRLLVQEIQSCNVFGASSTSAWLKILKTWCIRWSRRKTGIILCYLPIPSIRLLVFAHFLNWRPLNVFVSSTNHHCFKYVYLVVCNFVIDSFLPLKSDLIGVLFPPPHLCSAVQY